MARTLFPRREVGERSVGASRDAEVKAVCNTGANWHVARAKRGYLTGFLSEESPEERSIFICVCTAACCRDIHTNFQLTSTRREIILIGYLYDNLICIFDRACNTWINMRDKHIFPI